MKNSLIIGLLCLGIGFGTAWVMKDGPSGDPASNETELKRKSNPSGSKPPGALSGQPTKSDSKPADPKPEAAVVSESRRDEWRAQRRAGQDRWRDMMTKRQQAKEEAQIQKLIAGLGLSDAQADQLRAYFEKNRTDLAAMMEGGEEDWSKAKDFAKKLRGDGLEEELANILTDEQKASYDEMKQRDRSNKVEARAYKDLAKVQSVLDLSAEQKDQVYDILYDQAGNKVDRNKDANAMVSMFTEGLGITLDPEDLGISGAIQVQIDEAATTGEQPSQDPGAWMQKMQERRQQQIDEQVEALAPVLDENQQDTYRAHLESQGAGLLGGILGQAGVASEIDVDVTESIEIPAQPEPED